MEKLNKAIQEEVKAIIGDTLLRVGEMVRINHIPDYAVIALSSTFFTVYVNTQTKQRFLAIHQGIHYGQYEILSTKVNIEEG